ncbi:MAG: TldE/PmbA family protein [Rhodospirillaceae bacterium]|nr:MAG: TldE/PmbA family protein [Rhodospirillaceae bacterium]
MQEYFYALADAIAARLSGDEGFVANFSGERSHFVRFNRSAVRQPGTVTQNYLSLSLFRGRRHGDATITVTEDREEDVARIDNALATLREMVASAAEDPHFLVSTEVRSTERIAPDRLPTPDDAVEGILAAGTGEDLVGFYAAGPMYAGFANSFGQRNWHAVNAFNFDACFYLRDDPAIKDRAVKMDYAGFAWDGPEFSARAAAARDKLALLARPPKTLAPGGYRVFLAPAAMEDIMGMLSWDGFSLSARRTATTPLLRLGNGETFSPLVSVTENIADGLAPAFQSEGFISPDRIPLISRGAAAECLASPRSGVEFETAHNGAAAHESPQALDMAPGTLADSAILAALGTGVYMGNLWYLNYSDRNACRMTGMTRFATFWVENGVIVAPLNVMRFDDSAYRFLGRNLIGLTAAREWRLSTDTYESRSTRSMHLPGALIEDFRLTL